MPTPEIPLTEQLRCAKRELALRHNVYPRLVAQGAMLSHTAAKELAAMIAIVHTLEGLVAAADDARQPGLFAAAHTAGEAP